MFVYKEQLQLKKYLLAFIKQKEALQKNIHVQLYTLAQCTYYTTSIQNLKNTYYLPN